MTTWVVRAEALQNRLSLLFHLLGFSFAFQCSEHGGFYGASLALRKGPHFVRVVAYQPDPRIGSALGELARRIEVRRGPRAD